MLCPFCQTTIKKSADTIICSVCRTPHHQECWDENGGCTTYGCIKNSHLQKTEAIDIGNETLASLQNTFKKAPDEQGTFTRKPFNEENTTICPNCKNLTELNSVFCNNCGFKLKEFDNPEQKNEFETEFKRRYKEKSRFNKRRKLIFYCSLFLLVLIAGIALFFSYQKIDGYLNSDEYKIKIFVSEWQNTWESKDIFKYKELLDKDYIYYDKDNHAVTLEERIKRIAYTFENYKFIKIHVSNIRTTIDTASKQYANIIFDQSYVSDKKEESGKKTLRLYRGNETSWKWKIYREYFE